jgi:predicted transcriptional regulator
MTITEYGKVVREFREDVGASLRQMADEIGYSPTYVSAVEVGEKGITDDLVHKVVGFFRKRRKTTKDITRLHVAVDRTRRTVDVSSLDGAGRFAVAAFARKWADLDRDAREKFLQQIETTTERKK